VKKCFGFCRTIQEDLMSEQVRPHSPAAPASTHARPEYFIQALARGLRVLDAFSAERPELTIRDIAEIAEVSQPSALRIGYTLVETGFLVRNPVSKGYRPGQRIMSVALAALDSMSLPELAEPYLEDLRLRTQETVKMAVHAGPSVVFVSRLPSFLHPPAQRYARPSLPVHASSLGRAILAWLPADTARRLIEDCPEVRLTPNTPSKAEVWHRLPAIRARGYDINDCGATRENRAVSAPLLDAGHRAVGAINVSVSARRVSLSDMERRIAPLVVETARIINQTLPLSLKGSGWTSPALT
jgi:IclR family pca regulon transcriptional regulator